MKSQAPLNRFRFALWREALGCDHTPMPRHMASWEDLWDTVVNTSASLLPTPPSSPQRAPEEDANPPSPTSNVQAAPRSHAAFAATELCPPQSDRQAWKVTETPRVGSPGVDSSPEQPQETTLSDDDPTPPEQSVAMVVEEQAKKRRHSLGMNEWRKSASNKGHVSVVGDV